MGHFEQKRWDTTMVGKQDKEDFVIWSELHHHHGNHTSSPSPITQSLKKWTKPPYGYIKCNIGASWIDDTQNSGVSWLAQNHLGTTIFHSRRSYSNFASSLLNDLMSFYWAAECLRNMRISKVIFQASAAEVRLAFLQLLMFPHLSMLIYQILDLVRGFEEWTLEHIETAGNQLAIAIATSVTKKHQYPSYISKSSPAWLQSLLLSESSIN